MIGREIYLLNCFFDVDIGVDPDISNSTILINHGTLHSVQVSNNLLPPIHEFRCYMISSMFKSRDIKKLNIALIALFQCEMATDIAPSSKHTKQLIHTW